MAAVLEAAEADTVEQASCELDLTNHKWPPANLGAIFLLSNLVSIHLAHEDDRSQSATALTTSSACVMVWAKSKSVRVGRFGVPADSIRGSFSGALPVECRIC